MTGDSALRLAGPLAVMLILGLLSALILTSAVGGIPPLAATSVIAGAARMRLSLFGATCLTGRVVRFTIIAIPVAGWPYVSS